MKSFKKLAGLALAMIMALALMAPAMAAPAAGDITVENASKGESYKLVKLFDASFNEDTGAIVYTGTIPGEFTVTEKNAAGEDVQVKYDLNDYFVEDAQGYISATADAKGTDGKLTADAVKAITAWANQTSVTGINKTAGNGALVFDNLAYGYYVVVSRVSNGGAVTVTSNTPHAEVSDKNKGGNDPHFPATDGKVVKNAAGEKIKTATVGETVTYTVTYETVNWLMNDETGVADIKVYNYKIKDSLPDFLNDATITEIAVNGTSVKNTVDADELDAFGTTGEITVPWTSDGTEDGTSLYNNGATLTITYTAVVNSNILGQGEVNHKNTVYAGPNGDTLTDHTDSNLYTTTITVDKYAEDTENATNTNNKLAGAKFVLSREVEVEDPANAGWTKVVTQYYLVNANGNVSWVDSWQNATEVTTDENGDATFAGLKAGTYYLVETEAPAGYNQLPDSVEVVVSDATLNNSGDVLTNVTKDQSVMNSTGAVLPETGGIGTTIFYTLGGLLLVGSVILFVTKKRTGMAD